MAERKKLAAEFGPRYRKAGKSEKARIPGEYPALSGGKSRLLGKPKQRLKICGTSGTKPVTPT
jgi:hypothetical protein